MAFNSRNNLSNESAPWGREVEQKVESNTYDLNQLRLLTENNNKATNGTLSALTRQQTMLATQQTTLAAQQARQEQALHVESRDQSYTVTGSTGFTEYSSSIVPPTWASRAFVTVYQPSLSISRSPNAPSKVEGRVKVSTSPITDFASPQESAGWRVLWEDELVSRTSNTTPPVTTLERLRTFNVAAFSLDNLAGGVVYFGHSVVRNNTLVTPTITGQQVYRFDWY